jgi:glucuronosyltransferase
LLLIFLLPVSTSEKHVTPSSQASKRLNILLVSDTFYGHMAPLLGLGQELAQRGHNVTQFLALHEGQQVRYRAHVEKHGVNLWNVSSENLIKYDIEELIRQIPKTFFTVMLKEFSRYGADMMNIMAKHINKSLSAGEWDVMIGVDHMALVVSCLSHVHNIPTVYVGKLPGAIHLIPSYPWPWLFFGAQSDNMGFKERLLHSPLAIAMQAFAYGMHYPCIGILTEYCPSVGLRQSMTDIGVHIPAIVPNAIGFEYSRPISPMVQYVGPMIGSATPLSGELRDWLESKPDRSVVYVSMGSVISLGKDSGQAIIEGVMQTNCSMLWSLRKSNQWILEGLEIDRDRVLISEWTPQMSVLGSRAIHSAILHGGYNGITEALWNGVPIIVYPQMVEQAHNAGRVHFNGLGINLGKKDFSSSRISESLAAPGTGEYRSKVAKIQKIFRMAGGAKKAADYVELYANVGYAHLVPAYAKYQWNWVKYYNFDVYAAMLAILTVFLLSLRACCKCICKRCCSGSRKQKRE